MAYQRIAKAPNGKVGENLEVKCYEFTGTITLTELYKKGQPLPKSYALTTLGEAGPLLWFIHTRQGDRRRGFAKKLLGYLQKFFPFMVTGLDSTHEGIKLIKKMGFEKQEKAYLWKNPKPPDLLNQEEKDGTRKESGQESNIGKENGTS